MKTYEFINMKDEPEVLLSTPETNTESILLMKLVQSLCIIGHEMRERHKEMLAERAMLTDMLARFEVRLEALGLESDDIPMVDLNKAQEIDIRNGYPKDYQTPDDD